MKTLICIINTLCESIASEYRALDQVWSILPALELPPRLFTQQAKGIKNIHLSCLSYRVCSSWHQWWCVGNDAVMKQRHYSSPYFRFFACCGASVLITDLIYYEKCVLCKINRPYHKASKKASICVTWVSKLFGKVLDFTNVELQLKYCTIPCKRSQNKYSLSNILASRPYIEKRFSVPLSPRLTWYICMGDRKSVV